MFIPIGKSLEDVLSLDEIGELHEGDIPLLECLLGVHGGDLHVAFARLSLSGLNVNGGDEVSSLGDILFNSSPRLCNLVVTMMFWEIK
jgi:hypothetical protein